MEQLRRVYDMLEDEESRDIYINKVSYLITGKSCHLEHIIDICVPDLKRMKCSLAQDIRDRFPGFPVISPEELLSKHTDTVVMTGTNTIVY